VDSSVDVVQLAGLQVLGLTQPRVFTLPGVPHSKTRPKFLRQGHAYQDPADRAAEQVTGLRLRRAIPRKYPGNVGLACIFYRPNRQRIDTDNLLKHVMDAAQGILWDDDSQCTLLLGILEYDRYRPRTVVIVGEHASSMARGAMKVRANVPA
jgi:Holliday junction resolvase RusA-like endonuclease